MPVTEWSHRLAVECTYGHGQVTMPSGAVTTLAAADDALAVAIEAADAQALVQARQVLASHLDRFDFREEPPAFDRVDRSA